MAIIIFSLPLCMMEVISPGATAQLIVGRKQTVQLIEVHSTLSKPTRTRRRVCSASIVQENHMNNAMNFADNGTRCSVVVVRPES